MVRNASFSNPVEDMSKYYIVSTIFLVLLISSLIIDGAVDVPLWWYVILVVFYSVLCAIGSIVLSLGFFTSVISHGEQKGVAISFDDGPVQGKTDKILDILKQFDVTAAFFCIGNRVAANSALTKRITEEGHLIGNHSYYHRATFDLQSSTMIGKELSDTDIEIHKATGLRPRLFRPPYGVTNPMVAKAVRRRNYKVIGWTIRSFDTVISDPDKLFRRVTEPLKNGDIILFHDHCDSTLSILPNVLEHIHKSGLKVVRIDQLINEKAYA
jgi:peptidoglycan-N-acetylglucosamine deacetylase